MTKEGFKQILVSIDTYQKLKDFSVKEKKSMDGVLKGFLNSSGVISEGIRGFKSLPSHLYCFLGHVRFFPVFSKKFHNI